MKVLYAVVLILGCFLGAGFVSGREVASYFSRCGGISFFTCIVAGVLFFILTYFFFCISKQVRSAEEFVLVYFNKSKSLVGCLFSTCILIIAGSMFAGTYSLADSLALNKLLIMLFTVVLTFFVVSRNVRGMERVNVFLVPSLIVVLIFTMKIGEAEISNSGDVFGSVISGSGYVFVNIVSLGLLIIDIGHKYTRLEKFIIACICSIVITALLYGVNASILSNGLVDEMMPNLVLSSRSFPLYVCMQISIYLGLFTTLIANIYLLSGFVFKYINNRNLSILISIIASLIISSFGFDNIVGYVYIFIAFVGMFIVIGGVNKSLRNKLKYCV